MINADKAKPESDHILSREERIREIQSFNLLSDVFMSVALKDVPACQHILRILTGIDDLKVNEVRTQYTISRIKTHSVRLDVLAETGKGKLYHIEIQRKDEADPPKRIRYNGSLIDAEFLSKGVKYEALPDRIHFYISEKDIYHCGKAIYPIEKELGGTGLPYDDGVHIFFVNAAVDDGSRIAKLMKYFKTADPDDDSEGELSKRVWYLKREEGGVDIMCEVSERIMERGRKIGEEQGRKEQARSTALNLSQMGLTPEQIAGAVGESLEQVKNWLAGAKPAKLTTEEIELPEAVDRAIDECIRENVLRDFLKEHRAEARAMSIFEYDQERHMQQEREAGIEKGKEQLLHMQVQKNLARGMSVSEIAEVLDETEKRIREIASADPGEQEE